MTIREARQAAGLTQKGMSELLGIPKRTLEDWEYNKSSPPEWAERLILEKLEQIKEGKTMKVKITYRLQGEDHERIISSTDEAAIKEIVEENLNRGFWVEYIDAPDGGWTAYEDGYSHNLIKNTDRLRKRYISVKYHSVYDENLECRRYDEKISIQKETKRILKIFADTKKELTA